jgi:hypothetical protein
MSKQYHAAAEVIKGAITALNAILTEPEDELHRLKLGQTLQREADYLLLITGAGDATENKGSVLGPATTIGGKPIGKLPRITERDLRPSDDKVLALKDQVEAALLYFGPNGSSEGILANIPDMIIRGVAKKAGLHATKQDPELLTVEFIDQIKEALLEKGLVESKEAPKLTTEQFETISGAVANYAKNLPEEGLGGVNEVHEIPIEDIGKQMGAGVVTVDDPLDETKAEPAPEVTKAFIDETLANRPEAKPDTKKKAGK